MVINKFFFFDLLLLEISVTLLMNEMEVFPNLKKLKLLLILKLTFEFFKEFAIFVIFIKLINLNGLKNNISLKRWFLMRIRVYITLLIFI